MDPISIREGSGSGSTTRAIGSVPRTLLRNGCAASRLNSSEYGETVGMSTLQQASLLKRESLRISVGLEIPVDPDRPSTRHGPIP